LISENGWWLNVTPMITAATKEKIARRDSLLSASAALKRRLADAKAALDRALSRC
jgi:hypothetical protein